MHSYQEIINQKMAFIDTFKGTKKANPEMTDEEVLDSMDDSYFADCVLGSVRFSFPQYAKKRFSEKG